MTTVWTKTDTPPFVTIRQFCRYTGLSEMYVRDLVHRDAIPFVRVGNRAMIDADGAIQAIRQMAAKEAGQIA